MGKYRVQLKEWVDGSGFSYATDIDTIDERMTGAEYLAAVESNDAGYALDNDGNLFFEVIDIETNETVGEGVWGKETFPD